MAFDGGQAEAERGQFADQLQAGQVVGAVQPGPPAQLWRWEQPARGVEADGAHAGPAARGELVDGQLPG
jgi:hypothetical protein